MKRAALLLTALLAVTVAAGAPLERDLGQGLTYVRVAAAPADLPADVAGSACVLDLRYASATADASAALARWITAHAGARHLVLVLVNAATAPALLSGLHELPEYPGLLSIGEKSADFTPDLVVSGDAGRARRAYDAMAQAKDPMSLLSDTPDKARYDEAAIVKALATGQPAPEDPESTDPADDAKATPAPAPLIDAALQRALQIQRAWLALHAAPTG